MKHIFFDLSGMEPSLELISQSCQDQMDELQVCGVLSFLFYHFFVDFLTFPIFSLVFPVLLSFILEFFHSRQKV